MSNLFWKGIALLVLFAGYTGFVYHAGGADGRAIGRELALIQAGHVKEDARRTAAHDKLVKGLNNERIKATADARNGWAAYNRMRHNEGKSGDGAKSVPIVAGRCDSASDNAAISAAVSGFRDEVMAAVREFRDAVAGQLEQAQLNTDALMRLREWAAQEQSINR